MRSLTKFALSAMTILAAGSLSTQADAVVLTDSCSLTEIVPNASACTGYFLGNLINDANITAQHDALLSLGFDWDNNFAAAEKILGTGGASSVNFATPLSGITYIGLHFGGGGLADLNNGTAFFKFDAGSFTDLIQLTRSASSNAILYSTGTIGLEEVAPVPEPATWIMLIAGFALVGASLRRKQKQTVRLRFA